MADDGVTVCAIFRIPADGQAEFEAYEAAVLPLLRDHGANLLRRLRTDDGATEVHLIRFPSSASLDAYRADPARLAFARLFESSGATAEAFVVNDVASEPGAVTLM